MSSSTMTIRLEEKMKTRLDKLAVITHRSKSFLAAEAIREYINAQEWQINEIKKGLSEADAGDLIDHKKIVRYWERRHANSVDKERSK